MKFSIYIVFFLCIGGFLIPCWGQTNTNIPVISLNQYLAAIDSTLVPIVKRINFATPSVARSIDVVIISDFNLREKLSSNYFSYSKYFVFDSRNSVEFKEGGYRDRKTGKDVCINDFKLDISTNNLVIMSWNRVCGNLGGSFYKVEMKSIDDKWVVIGVKLINNS
jgi:hypothetical protein